MGFNGQATSHADSQWSVEEWEMIHIHPLKAAFDKLVALLVIVILSPLIVLIALAIKIDGWLYPDDQGPVLYEEARVSQDRVFNLYKFRVLKTAMIEAARQKKGYDHAKPLEGREENKTRVGRWLQRWYLDEVPQLFNVLKGDMSLVGPRPWPVPEYEAEIARGIYRKRILRPGLTGLVQAHKDELNLICACLWTRSGFWQRDKGCRRKQDELLGRQAGMCDRRGRLPGLLCG